MISSTASTQSSEGQQVQLLVRYVAISVPMLGAVVGGFAGVIAGKGLGNLEGRGVALLINDKETDLPLIVHCIFTSMDNG
jgi:hypothetical protein